MQESDIRLLAHQNIQFAKVIDPDLDSYTYLWIKPFWHNPQCPYIFQLFHQVAAEF